jgi:hypothetical protein
VGSDQQNPKDKTVVSGQQKRRQKTEVRCQKTEYRGQERKLVV